MEDILEFDESLVQLVREIREQVHPRAIEIGFEPDPFTGDDPLPGDPTTWYVVLDLSDGRTIRRQARGLGMRPVIEALAAAAEAVGLSVRVRYLDGYS